MLDPLGALTADRLLPAGTISSSIGNPAALSARTREVPQLPGPMIETLRCLTSSLAIFALSSTLVSYFEAHGRDGELDGTPVTGWYFKLSGKEREWMAKKEALRAVAGMKGGSKASAKKKVGLPASKRAGKAAPKIEVISSKLSYEGPLFRVYTDEIVEGGRKMTRDVVRHNGSIVILAIDDSKSKRDPMIVMERQYRHAAKEYLLEVPAGKMEAGEDALAGAKRELLEETGFVAARWRKVVRYFASPGFLGEFMQVFIAEGLTAGEAQPEYDEQIEIELIPLSRLLAMIDAGEVHDGKTLISVMLYDRLNKPTKKKTKK